MSTIQMTIRIFKFFPILNFCNVQYFSDVSVGDLIGAAVNVVVSLFDVLLQSTPKQESKRRDCPTLAALKVIFDWLRSDPDLLSDPLFNSFS